MAISIERMDHFVITASDIDKTINFYKRVLGMSAIVFANDRKALRFGNQKINIHQAGKEVKPNAQNAAIGTADICFISERSLETVQNHLQSEHIRIESGPIEQHGAVGIMDSVYFRDPDGNLIEVGVYRSTTTR